MRFSPTRMFVAEAGCLYPFRRDVRPPPERENAKMRRGKDLHVAIERALLSQPAVGDRPEVLHAYRWATERWSVLHCETPIGIDPTNGTARQYDTKDDIPDDHVAVVVDVHSREAAAVYDWKTGSQFSSFSYAPQVKLNGYAVAALLGVEDVESGLAYVSAHGITAKSWQNGPRKRASSFRDSPWSINRFLDRLYRAPARLAGAMASHLDGSSPHDSALD